MVCDRKGKLDAVPSQTSVIAEFSTATDSGDSTTIASGQQERAWLATSSDREHAGLRTDDRGQESERRNGRNSNCRLVGTGEAVGQVQGEYAAHPACQEARTSDGIDPKDQAAHQERRHHRDDGTPCYRSEAALDKDLHEMIAELQNGECVPSGNRSASAGPECQHSWPMAFHSMPYLQLLPQGRAVDSQDLGGRSPVARAFDEQGSQDWGLGEFQESFVERRAVGPGIRTRGRCAQAARSPCRFRSGECAIGPGIADGGGRCSGRIGWPRATMAALDRMPTREHCRHARSRSCSSTSSASWVSQTPRHPSSRQEMLGQRLDVFAPLARAEECGSGIR